MLSKINPTRSLALPILLLIDKTLCTSKNFKNICFSGDTQDLLILSKIPLKRSKEKHQNAGRGPKSSKHSFKCSDICILGVQYSVPYRLSKCLQNSIRRICACSTESQESIGWPSLHQFDDNTQLQNIPYTSCCVDQIKAEKLPHQKLTPPYKEKYLNNVDFSHLKLCIAYPSKTLEVVSRFYKEYRNVVINSVQFTSKISRSQRSSVIAA